MAEQHRATASEWACIRVRADDKLTYSCILELLHRIEALEAPQSGSIDLSHLSDAERERMAQEVMQAAGFAPRWSDFDRFFAGIEAPKDVRPAKSNHPAKPGGSLVERVACAIYPDGLGDGFREEAREAIRAVTAWMREQRPWGVAFWAQLLEQEAERC